MARALYGLDLASYAVDATSGKPVPFAAFTVWPAQVGGDPLSDLQDLSGATISTVIADSQGYVGFWGPDGGNGDLWLQGAAAPRLLVRPVGLTGRVQALETSVATTSGITQSAADLRYAQIAALNGKVSKGELARNVMDYGVAGDGVTDDRSAIQAVINAAPAGGLVLIPPGTYLIGGSQPLLMRPGVTVAGYRSPRWPYDTPAPCKLILSSSFTGRAAVLFLGAAELLSEFGVNLGTGVGNFGGRLRDLSIDCQNIAPLGTVVDAVRIEGDVRNVTLENLDATHPTGSTLHVLAGATSGSGRGHEVWNVRGNGDGHAFWMESGFSDCTIRDCLAWGSTSRTSSTGDGFNMVDCAETHMIGCRAVFRNGNGFVLQGTGQTGGIQVTNISTDRNQKCGLRLLRRGFGNNVLTNVRLHRDGINGRNVAGQETTRDSTYAALEIIGVSTTFPTSPVSIDGLSISVSDNDSSVGAKAPDVGIRLKWTSEVDIRGVVGAVVTPVDDQGSHATTPLLPELQVIGDRTAKTYTPAPRPTALISGHAEVAADESTTSATYGNLTTTGPSVTLPNVPAGAIIMVYAEATIRTANASSAASAAVSEVTSSEFTNLPILSTTATADERRRTCAGQSTGVVASLGGWHAIPVAAAGNKTVRMVYKATTGGIQADFTGRKLWAYVVAV